MPRGYQAFLNAQKGKKEQRLSEKKGNGVTVLTPQKLPSIKGLPKDQWPLKKQPSASKGRFPNRKK